MPGLRLCSVRAMEDSFHFITVSSLNGYFFRWLSLWLVCWLLYAAQLGTGACCERFIVCVSVLFPPFRCPVTVWFLCVLSPVPIFEGNAVVFLLRDLSYCRDSASCFGIELLVFPIYDTACLYGFRHALLCLINLISCDTGPGFIFVIFVFVDRVLLFDFHRDARMFVDFFVFPSLIVC